MRVGEGNLPHFQMFIITDKDATLDYVTDPRNIIARRPETAETFRALKQMRDATDEAIGFRGDRKTRKQSSNMKVIGRVQEHVLIAALAVEQDLLRDKKKLYAWLRRNKAAQAYTMGG